jgi:hypothetical protein
MMTPAQFIGVLRERGGNLEVENGYIYFVGGDGSAGAQGSGPPHRGTDRSEADPRRQAPLQGGAGAAAALARRVHDRVAALPEGLRE